MKEIGRSWTTFPGGLGLSDFRTIFTTLKYDGEIEEKRDSAIGSAGVAGELMGDKTTRV